VPTLLILRPQDVIPADFHGGERFGAALSSPEPFRFVRNYLQGQRTLDRQAVWGSAPDATWIVLRFEEPADRCHLARARSSDQPTWWVEFEETISPRIGPGRMPTTRRRAVAGQADYLIRSANAGFSILAREALSPAQQEWQRQVMGEYVPPEPDISWEIRIEAAPIQSSRLFSRQEIAAMRRQIPQDPAVARALSAMRDTALDPLWLQTAALETDTSGIPVRRANGMPSNRAIANRTPPPPSPAPKAAAKHTLGRCENCEHFYEDHGGDDQCPGEYGGDPRAHPTWAPPEVARLLDTEPSKPADSQDIHAERYRMIELD
jgi:hypothetical protein